MSTSYSTPPVPAPSQPKLEQTNKKPKAWLLPTITGVVALLVGITAGGSGGVSQEDLDAAQASLTTAEASLKTAQQERDTAQGKLDEITGSAEETERLLQEREKSIEDSAAKVEESQAKLDEREAAVKKREEAVTGAEKKAKESTFGEGRWIVGEDIKAGTYKTTEPVTSTMCYWAITTSGSNGDDILSNDFGMAGNHTVTLKKGQDFESSNCGSWKLQ